MGLAGSAFQILGPLEVSPVSLRPLADVDLDLVGGMLKVC